MSAAQRAFSAFQPPSWLLASRLARSWCIATSKSAGGGKRGSNAFKLVDLVIGQLTEVDRLDRPAILAGQLHVLLFRELQDHLGLMFPGPLSDSVIPRHEFEAAAFHERAAVGLAVIPERFPGIFPD